MVENQKYKIMRNEGRFFYAIKIRGRISLWLSTEGQEKKLLEDDYTDITILTKKYDRFDFCEECYLFLKEKHGVCSIVEIIDNKIIKTFSFKDFRKMYRIIINDNGKEEQDEVIIFWNSKKKIYSIWSILRGNIFGPYEYTDIESFRYGVILDGVIAVKDNGYSFDISDLSKVCERMYYDKNNEAYMFLVDEDDSLFEWMERDEEDENIYKLEMNDNIYTFNSETYKLDCKVLPLRDDYDYYHDWSKYSDVAYEGYSRSYLGLDD